MRNPNEAQVFERLLANDERNLRDLERYRGDELNRLRVIADCAERYLQARDFFDVDVKDEAEDNFRDALRLRR